MAPPLNETVQGAVDLLTTLSTGASDSATGPMNPNNLRASKGLLFTTMTKTGAVVGYENISGFIMLRKPDGSFTAPSFVSGKNFTVGATIGHTKASTLLVLFSDRAIAGACKPFKLGVDFNLAMYPIDFQSGKNLDLTSMDTDSVGYGVGKGLIIDLSLNGGQLTPDEVRNAEVYGGQSVTVDSILDGSVDPPAEFEPLYAKIKELIARAGIPGQAVPAHLLQAGDWQAIIAEPDK